MNENVDLTAQAYDGFGREPEASVIVTVGVYGATTTLYISKEQAASFALRLMGAAQVADRITDDKKVAA